MDNRCRRLGVFKYFIYDQEFETSATTLFYELYQEPDTEAIRQVLNRLRFARKMIKFSFLDRTIIFFPEVPYDSPFQKVASKALDELAINYFCYEVRRKRRWENLRCNPISFYKLFDYEEQKWKIQDTISSK